MGNTTSLEITSPQLFQLCATCPEERGYWDEFIRRFNPLLVRSMVVTWRKYHQGNLPPENVATELLQEIYLTIIKGEFHLLKRFRGETEAEAEAYLAHAAINRTISHIRSIYALQHQADEVSLEQLLEEKGERVLAEMPRQRQAALTEHELVETLQQVFTGPNSKRDLLLFLLHTRDGYTAAEIARLGLCELKESSIYNLLGQMKTRLKNYFGNNR